MCVTTLSPGVKVVTEFPTALTMPAPSEPGMRERRMLEDQGDGKAFWGGSQRI